MTVLLGMSETRAEANTAGSGDPAYRTRETGFVGPVPSPGAGVVSSPGGSNMRPCRLRRLHRIWPDRDGNISYLLTLCVDGRTPVLSNDETFGRLVSFLFGSPSEKEGVSAAQSHIKVGFDKR